MFVILRFLGVYCNDIFAAKDMKSKKFGLLII